MKQRRFDKLGVSVSLLGFGCMRFPCIDDKIDETEAEKMLDYAYEHGVNYFDTAFPYHNMQSETFIGKVLDKYPRDSYYLATKLPVWLVKSLDDAKGIFQLQLERLHKDYIDFYLIHALNQQRFEEMKALGVLDYFEDLKKEGKIKYFGFSFHDDYKAFQNIITDRNWDFCQIQYNYFDHDEQAGDKGYALAEKLGIPFVIMEPLKGGTLCNFSDDINDIFHSANPDASVASYGLRWVADHSNVKVILSGMSTMDQVKDNIQTIDHYTPLTAKESEAILAVEKALRARIKIGCTGCRYCMPCPAGVDIPGNFSVWNTYHMFQNYNPVRWQWETGLVDGKSRADVCIKCGACETKCPQKLPIRDALAHLTEELNHPIYK